MVSLSPPTGAEMEEVWKMSQEVSEVREKQVSE